MLSCHFANFDIHIHGTATPYAVRASYGRQAAVGAFHASAEDAAWAARLQQLAAASQVPQSAPTALGAELFQTLFQGQLRDLWIHARSELDQGQIQGLRLRLLTPPASVATLPWELLYDPERALVLAAGTRTSVVRVENLFHFVGSVRPLQSRLPLRVLVVTPNDPTGRIEPAREQTHLATALAPLMPEGVQLTPLQGEVSVLDIRAAVERLQPDVLHVVTHGQPDGLLLWQAAQPVLTDANALRMALQDTPSLRLIYLNACATGQSTSAASLTSVGAQLLQTGVPAVIAMQFDMSDQRAVQFAEQFYIALLAGRCPGAVDAAVGYARSSLYAMNPDDFSFGTPLLWLNSEDGLIFAAERPLQLRQRAVMPPVDVQALKNQRAELEEWISQIQVPDRSTLPLGLLSQGMILQAKIQEFKDLIGQIKRDEYRLGTPAEAATAERNIKQKLDRLQKSRSEIIRLLALLLPASDQ